MLVEKMVQVYIGFPIPKSLLTYSVCLRQAKVILAEWPGQELNFGMKGLE